jgi:hypothetical protein
LPPQGDEVVYEGSAITGAVDVNFEIGPLYYNFIDIRYIGEPVLRARLIEPSRNVTIINNTVNVTNITYNNRIVANNGPDLNRLNRFSNRQIERLTLQRESTVPTNLGQGGHRGNFNRVSGRQFVVVTPRIQKSTHQIAPRQVKAKVESPQIERGWQGVPNREQIEAGMKKENPRKISEPTFQPQKDRRTGTAVAPGQNAHQPNEPRSATQNPPAGGNDQQAERGVRRLPRDYRNPNDGQGMSTYGGAEQAQKEKPAGTNDLQAERQKNDEARKARDFQAERAEQARRAMEVQQADRARRAAQAQQIQPQAAQHAHTTPVARPGVQQVPPPNSGPYQQQTHRPQQANPPQPQGGNQSSDGEHKNKKKKPDEEPPPQG